MVANANFQTDKAARYMKALCNHFGRKIEAKYEDNEGWIDFPFGRCDLRADNDGLSIRVEGHDTPTLLQLKRVVGSHLERFTQNELVSLDWMDELESKHGGLK